MLIQLSVPVMFQVLFTILMFNVELPQDVGEPLGKIVIRQCQGQQDVKFRL